MVSEVCSHSGRIFNLYLPMSAIINLLVSFCITTEKTGQYSFYAKKLTQSHTNTDIDLYKGNNSKMTRALV